MPRKPEVEQHPDRAKIVKALIKGDKSLRAIAGQYGTSKSALQRYLNKHLLPRAAKAAQERELKDGESVLKYLERIIADLQMMLDACKDYLRDPEDPDKFYLGPQAQEITVGYWEINSDGKRGPVQKRKLSDLLNEIESTGKVISSVNTKHADPRDLLIKAVDSIGRQLKTVSEIHGLISNVSINITQVQQWQQIKTVILNAVEDHPEVREKIVNDLNRIAHN